MAEENSSGIRANLGSLTQTRYSCEMRPLRYSINVTLDGCCDHRAISSDEDLHRHAVENSTRPMPSSLAG
jgi:hypothetical protein